MDNLHNSVGKIRNELYYVKLVLKQVEFEVECLDPKPTYALGLCAKMYPLLNYAI